VDKRLKGKKLISSKILKRKCIENILIGLNIINLKFNFIF